MYKKMHRKVLIFLIITVALSSCAKQQAGEKVSETRLLLDTYCTITVYSSVDNEALADILDKAFKLCREYEELFSITIEGSDVWRINHAGGSPVEVDSRTVEVIRAGLEFGELSSGMFDITIGRLSRLWDFNEYYKPAVEEIAAAKVTVDYSQVKIDGNYIALSNSDTWIDLGAIAKGYIADKIAEYLIEKGIISAIIDLGRDIVTIGTRQDGKAWRIGVAKPFGNDSDYIGVLEITDAAVVSSGVYERGFEENGIWYHHILDPGTGMPVISDVINATVIADNALTGEGLSTIAILAGSAKAMELLAQTPGFIGAILVIDDGEVLTFGDVRLVQ